MSSPESETLRLVNPAEAVSKYFAASPQALGFEFGGASHIGLRRESNQDHYLIMRRTRTQDVLLSNIPKEVLPFPPDHAYGMVVADGIGGSTAGDMASQLAIRAAWELTTRTTSWVMKLGDLNTHELAERVEAYAQQMQQAFRDEYEANPFFGDSGTTWTMAYFVSSFAVVANLGDSPAFLWRDGMMGQISTDHTVEQEFIAAGVNREIAAKYHHMLTRCLAFDSPDVRPDVHHLRVQPGDQLLLCTDGLTDMVPAVDIAQCIDEATSAQAACDKLIELALAGGGKDNITVTLARVKTPAS